MKIRMRYLGRDRQRTIFPAAIILTLCLSHAFSHASLFDPAFQIGAGANGAVNAIIVQQDGKILVGGEFTTIAGQTNAYLARLNSDGQLDTTFGSGTDGVVNRLLQLPDGNILVAGEFENLQGVSRHGLARLLTNGLVDLSFDTGTNFESDEIVSTICVQPDGKIVAASEKIVFYYLWSRFSRFHSNGQLDMSFARTNVASLNIFALLPLADGSILVGGSFHELGTQPYSALALLQEDGQVDTNMVPVLTNSLSGFQTASTVFSLTQLTNGNILVGGLLNLTTTNQKAIAQLTPQLQWDTNFNADDFGSEQYARSVLVQADGKFVVGGVFYEVGGYWRRHIVRLNSEGHVNSCFDPGIGLGDIFGARALAAQDDGRILVGGSFDSTPWAGVSNIARFLPQGECGAMRTYLIESEYGMIALGTCPPGGTNSLQTSTNLVDWVTLDTQTKPYVTSVVDATQTNAFFRVRKEF